MEIKIEKASPEDAEHLLEFLKTVGGETDNLTFGAEGLPISIENERDFIASSSNATSSVMYLAKKGNEIVGTAGFNGMQRERMKHRGELSVCVKRAEWGKGIGSMLIEAVIDFAKNTAHAEIISLEVRSDNIRAIKLYEKYGFEKIGDFRGFFKINGAYVDFDLMNLYMEA